MFVNYSIGPASPEERIKMIDNYKAHLKKYLWFIAFIFLKKFLKNKIFIFSNYFLISKANFIDWIYDFDILGRKFLI